MSDRLMDELLSMGVVDPYVGATLPAPLVFGVSDTPEPPPDRYEAYAMDCEGYGYTPPSAVPATTEGGELEALLARAAWLLNSTVGERIAAGVAPEDVIRDLASALRRQRDIDYWALADYITHGSAVWGPHRGPVVNHIDISHDDVRCTITTPGPLPAEAYPLIERLHRTVAEVAVALAKLSGIPAENGPEPRPAPPAKPNPSDGA